MTQVSRRPLKKEVEEKLFEVFWEVFELMRTKKEAESFLKELLTPTEEIMLAKRVAVALMLLKGYDYREIQDSLNVSATTVGKVSLWLRRGGEGYRRILEKIIKRQKVEEFWEKVDGFLGKVLPPPKGRDWKNYYRQKYTARRKTPVD